MAAVEPMSGYRHTDDLSRCGSLSREADGASLRCIKHQRDLINESWYVMGIDTEPAYEVWQVSVRVSTGKEDSKRLVGTAPWQKGAQDLADEYEAEAEENFRMESRGPVKPQFRKIFVVARRTEQREAVCDATE